MRFVILSLILVSVFISCDVKKRDKIADDSAKAIETALRDSTSVMIIDSTYDFGKTEDGNKVEYNYRFTNTGMKPLVILNATASCGCTVPEKPEKPIMPGDTGFIKVIFNSKDRVGVVHKTISVNSNAYPKFPELQLKGEVIKSN
jgi:hypothetical protein